MKHRIAAFFLAFCLLGSLAAPTAAAAPDDASPCLTIDAGCGAQTLTRAQVEGTRFGEETAGRYWGVFLDHLLRGYLGIRSVSAGGLELDAGALEGYLLATGETAVGGGGVRPLATPKLVSACGGAVLTGDASSLTVVCDIGDMAGLSWALDAVQSLYDAGRIHGNGAGCFDPWGDVTRADLLQLLGDTRPYELGTPVLTRGEARDLIAAATGLSDGDALLQGDESGALMLEKKLSRVEAVILVARSGSIPDPGEAPLLAVSGDVLSTTSGGTYGGHTLFLTQNDVLQAAERGDHLQDIWVSGARGSSGGRDWEASGFSLSGLLSRAGLPQDLPCELTALTAEGGALQIALPEPALLAYWLEWAEPPAALAGESSPADGYPRPTLLSSQGTTLPGVDCLDLGTAAALTVAVEGGDTRSFTTARLALTGYAHRSYNGTDCTGIDLREFLDTLGLKGDYTLSLPGTGPVLRLSDLRRGDALLAWWSEAGGVPVENGCELRLYGHGIDVANVDFLILAPLD